MSEDRDRQRFFNESSVPSEICLKLWRALLIICLPTLLLACGQKGALYLPESRVADHLSTQQITDKTVTDQPSSTLSGEQAADHKGKDKKENEALDFKNTQ